MPAPCKRRKEMSAQRCPIPNAAPHMLEPADGVQRSEKRARRPLDAFTVGPPPNGGRLRTMHWRGCAARVRLVYTLRCSSTGPMAGATVTRYDALRERAGGGDEEALQSRQQTS